MRKRNYKDKRPKRLGAMQIEPTRHVEPSYFRVLVSAGLIDRKTDIQNAWGIWQRVCADLEVIRLSMAKAAKKKPVYLVSIAAPFQNGAQVLAAMSIEQRSALKERLGISKGKV